jgi:N6-adenosine-specific RNA methylase IME4
MSAPDEKLTKLTGDVIAAVSAQVSHLVDVGLVEPEKLRLTIEARRDKAKELVDAGMSQRQVAEALRVGVATVNRDLAFQSGTESVPDRNERTKQKQEVRRNREEGLALKTPQGKYGVIYADPPWKFEVYSEDTGLGRVAEAHYSTMAVEDIAAIPVSSFAADDCVLFMWATAPHLREAFTLLDAWGFSYKTHCVWAKDKIGLGFWFRNQHELLIIATRGTVPAPAHGTQWSSLIEQPRHGHSEKPEAFYQLIETYFPNLPKIELFARNRRDGWECWGFEAPLAAQAAE